MKIHYRYVFMRVLLLLSGNVERNPGPTQLNYSLNDPNLCGFYRAAIYSVFTFKKLIPGEHATNVTEKEQGIVDI